MMGQPPPSRAIYNRMNLKANEETWREINTWIKL